MSENGQQSLFYVFDHHPAYQEGSLRAQNEKRLAASSLSGQIGEAALAGANEADEPDVENIAEL